MALGLRREILEAIFRPEAPTPRDIENGLRIVLKDPILAEQKIGEFYGRLFRRLEMAYDARGGRRFVSGVPGPQR
jgi:hypothetical protein